MVAHGVLTAAIGADNLANGLSLQLNDGPGSSGGNLTTLDKKEIKRRGVDAEAFKRDVVGKESASTFNVALDKKGNVFLVAVKKGKQVTLDTGHTMDQLIQFYPIR